MAKNTLKKRNFGCGATVPSPVVGKKGSITDAAVQVILEKAHDTVHYAPAVASAILLHEKTFPAKKVRIIDNFKPYETR